MWPYGCLGVIGYIGCATVLRSVPGPYTGPDEEVGDWANPPEESWGEETGEDQMEEQEAWDDQTVHDGEADASWAGKPLEEEVWDKEMEEAWEEDEAQQTEAWEQEEWEQEACEKDGAPPDHEDEWPPDRDAEDEELAGEDAWPDGAQAGNEGCLFHILIQCCVLGRGLYPFFFVVDKVLKMASWRKKTNG